MTILDTAAWRLAGPESRTRTTGKSIVWSGRLSASAIDRSIAAIFIDDQMDANDDDDNNNNRHDTLHIKTADKNKFGNMIKDCPRISPTSGRSIFFISLVTRTIQKEIYEMAKMKKKSKEKQVKKINNPFCFVFLLHTSRLVCNV